MGQIRESVWGRSVRPFMAALCLSRAPLAAWAAHPGNNRGGCVNCFGSFPLPWPHSARGRYTGNYLIKPRPLPGRLFPLLGPFPRCLYAVNVPCGPLLRPLPGPPPWLGQDVPARQASPRSAGGAKQVARRILLKRIPAYIPPEFPYYPLF